MTNASKIINISKKKTCIRMAKAEWDALDVVCKRENIKRNTLVELINANKSQNLSLTCSIRLFTLIYLYQLFIEKQKPNYSNTKIKPVNAIFYAIKGIL